MQSIVLQLSYSTNNVLAMLWAPHKFIMEGLYKPYAMRTPLVLGGISRLLTPCADSVGE